MFAIFVIGFIAVFSTRLYYQVQKQQRCAFRPNDIAALAKNYPFFERLNERNRKDFLKRLCHLMRSTTIHLRSDAQLTREQRILIAAPWIILNWKLDELEENIFKKVFIYPAKYYNRNTGQFYHGEVNPKGVVVLSLERINYSLENPDDAIHLLFHEYAHALVIARMESDYFGKSSFYKQYERLVKKHFQHFESRYKHFLRSYGGTDEMEFFAVAIEAFFEQGELMKEMEPILYNDLCNLLKFDPLLIQN